VASASHSFDKFFPAAGKETGRMNEKWMRSQDELAQLSTNSFHVVNDAATHGIARELRGLIVSVAARRGGPDAMVGLKLLVVEDDAPSLELMTEVFRSLKADVLPVSDSEEAALRVNREKFDGIFLDLEMPNLNGFDLARRVRKSSWNKSTPIIIVTGQDERETMQQAFAVGATFFLQKPIDRQKLSKLFRTVRGGMLENRRRYTRVPLRADVTCTLGSRILSGVSWNLSQGGMQVEVDGLHLKDAVRLSFRLPVSGEAIESAGTVVWGAEKRQGIQFTNVSAKNQKSIRQFVSEVDQIEG
jgi:CheY-like chemotaxis protein